MFAKKRIPPFISLTSEETVEKLCHHFEKLRESMGQSSGPIAFTVGVDAIVVVKSWQKLPRHGTIVGASYPNHFLLIGGKSDEEIVALLKECTKGNHGEKAAEVKVAVISLQVAPKGFSPYFTLVGRAQTINESNDF